MCVKSAKMSEKFQKLMNYRPCCPCGGELIGDGYISTMHCEFAEEEAYEFKEPDAAPTLCKMGYEIVEERIKERHARQEEAAKKAANFDLDRRYNI